LEGEKINLAYQNLS